MASIQGVYLALFGRPADPIGLSFFNQATGNGANLTAIGDLASTPEYQARFQGQTSVQIINSIYLSLFNRPADLAGLTFFSNALATGALNINNIAIAIFDGAQGTDITIRDLKVSAADAFTASIDTSAEVLGYQGTNAAASARGFIANVTETAPTADQVTAAVAAAVQAGTQGGGSGATFTLTSATDLATNSASFINNTVPTDFRFTSASETVSSSAGTLQSADVLQDSSTSDNDALNLTVSAANNLNAAPTVSNIEQINIVSTGAAALGTLSLANVTGAKAITVSGTFGSAAITNFAASGVTSVDASAVTAGGITITPTANTTADLTIKGGAGNDFLSGSAGNDTISGGAGDDTISGGAGDNVIDTGAGTNTVTAGNGVNNVTGGSGVDNVTLGSGNNTVALGDGANVLTATGGNNTVTSGSGDDSITLGNGTNSVTSGGGVDTISVGTGANTIVAGGGNDNITFANGGSGKSTLTAGTGADVVNLGTTGGAITINIGAGDTGFATAAVTDNYTNFITGNDQFNFGIAAADALNYVEAGAAVLDYATALAAADVALNGTVRYFLQDVGANSFLFIDRDGDGTSDGAVTLTGVTTATFAATDIIG